MSNKLSPSIVEAYILDGSSHTLRNICETFIADETQERQIDKIIQRLRKQGKIVKTRIGRNILWTAVPSRASQED